MGTVVRGGTGCGVVVRTGSATQLGQIAARLGGRMPETAFQQGLRAFSGLLVWVTAVVTTVVFVVNATFRHSVFESLLFALAIAVSLTPQLLPAIVTVSLATGARRMAARSVLVKRLVSIEDLGNMAVLFTDKTGTLTEGQTAFAAALDPNGALVDGAKTWFFREVAARPTGGPERPQGRAPTHPTDAGAVAPASRSGLRSVPVTRRTVTAPPVTASDPDRGGWLRGSRPPRGPRTVGPIGAHRNRPGMGPAGKERLGTPAEEPIRAVRGARCRSP